MPDEITLTREEQERAAAWMAQELAKPEAQELMQALLRPYVQPHIDRIEEYLAARLDPLAEITGEIALMLHAARPVPNKDWSVLPTKHLTELKRLVLGLPDLPEELGTFILDGNAAKYRAATKPKTPTVGEVLGFR
jgi:hypothetical protein